MRFSPKKFARKLFLALMVATILAIGTISSYANTLRVLATSDDGSYALLSCGSSAGDFVVVWSASTQQWSFFDAEPGQCSSRWF